VRRAVFTELEVELEDGDDGDLDRIEKILRKAGARRGAGTPKLFRVIGVAEESAPKPEAPLAEHVQHYLERQLVELEARDPGVRLGTDPDDVHRFRVATRRTRAARPHDAPHCSATG